jgi:hypothetical protein
MKKTIALALMLALAGGFVHADENKADAKKSEKAKSNAKKKEQKHASDKSDKNAFQKAESDIGHWARKNKIWGTPRPGD